MELGNWYTYQWRAADAEAKADGNAVTFTFRPVNAKEFPNLKDYPAAFRYTLKLRVVSEAPLPKIERIEAFTDSTLEPRIVNLAWKSAPAEKASFEAFNGAFEKSEKTSSRSSRLTLHAAVNADPNTFDRTLVTVRNGQARVHFRGGRPEAGRAVRAARRRGGIAGRRHARLCGGGRRPEEPRAARRFTTAWRKCRSRPGTPPGRACRPRNPTSTCRWGSTAGGSGSGSMPTARCGSAPTTTTCRAGRARRRRAWRLNPRPVRFRFQPPLAPVFRTIEEACLPIGHTVWETNGVRISQTAFATELNGAKADGPVPAADAFTVFLAKFVFTNITGSPQTAALPLTYRSGDTAKAAPVGRERLALARRQRARAGAGRQSARRRGGDPELDLDAGARRKQDRHRQDPLPGADRASPSTRRWRRWTSRRSSARSPATGAGAWTKARGSSRRSRCSTSSTAPMPATCSSIARAIPTAPGGALRASARSPTAPTATNRA